MATLEEEMLAQKLGYPNFTTMRLRERNARIREDEEELRGYERQEFLERERRRRAGAPPSPHIFTIPGGDPEAARAALAERQENYRQAAEQAAPEPEGDGGAS